MKKAIFAILVITLSFLCTSCESVRNTYIVNDEQQAKACFEKIRVALEAKDTETFETLFSKQARTEVDDIEDEIQKLFDFIDGKIISWKYDGDQTSYSISEHKREKSICSWHVVNTDNEIYRFFIIDNVLDDINPDNVGLYAVRVIKEKNYEEQRSILQKTDVPGIYVPDDDTASS